MKRWSKHEIEEISEYYWLTPDVMAWHLNLKFGNNRSIGAVIKKQRFLFGSVPKSEYETNH